MSSGEQQDHTRSTRALAAAERVRDGVTRDESRKREAGRVERRVRRKTNARGRVSRPNDETREADVETLLFEGKKHYSRVIRWRRRAEHEMVVK